ncbi:MAG: SDR family NAD(P)-dependent oxidoreductase, partial [Rhizobiales bacterium]|nr:SDR family NAD(P)-dependent oxidoreductase [Hyphomicrobiales bacterium]
MPEQSGKRFAGKAALVTGAAGGIGRAIARRLAEDGARVTLTDIDAARLEHTIRDFADQGFDAAGIACDLGDAAERDRLVPAVVAKWGRIDILVNNAAFHGPRRNFLDSSESDWQAVFLVNVIATGALCQQAAQAMRGTGGAIVNIGSIQADMPVPTYTAYATSKGAIASLTMTEAEVSNVLPEIVAGHLTSASFFENLDLPEARRFVAAFKQRFGASAPITSSAEAVYCQVHLFAKALALAGDDDPELIAKHL